VTNYNKAAEYTIDAATKASLYETSATINNNELSYQYAADNYVIAAFTNHNYYVNAGECYYNSGEFTSGEIDIYRIYKQKSNMYKKSADNYVKSTNYATTPEEKAEYYEKAGTSYTKANNNLDEDSPDILIVDAIKYYKLAITEYNSMITNASTVKKAQYNEKKGDVYVLLQQIDDTVTNITITTCYKNAAEIYKQNKIFFNSAANYVKASTYDDDNKDELLEIAYNTYISGIDADEQFKIIEDEEEPDCTTEEIYIINKYDVFVSKQHEIYDLFNEQVEILGFSIPEDEFSSHYETFLTRLTNPYWAAIFNINEGINLMFKFTKPDDCETIKIGCVISFDSSEI
jgi:hypothetical protein